MSGFLDDIRHNFLATGVGSLPFADAAVAVDTVFDIFTYHIPFWPQLPRRSFAENMVVQFSQNFPGIRTDEAERSVWVETSGASFADDLGDCFSRCLAADVDSFPVGPEHAQGLALMAKRLMGMSWQGWVKAQVLGPFSMGLSLLDESRNPILYDKELGELLPLFLSMKAAWIIRQVRAHARTRIIIFIDEPYLVAVGTAQCSLKPQEIVEMINQVVRVIHDNGALAGIHCCGNTDWGLVLATDVDILNFDAYEYLDKVLLYEKALSAFCRKGGFLAAGIVPNNDDLRKEGLSEHLLDILRRHSAFMQNGLLITTSCGLSGLAPALVPEALNLCVSLAEKLREEFS